MDKELTRKESSNCVGGLTAEVIRVSGISTKSLDLESSNGQMDRSTPERWRTARNEGSERWSGLMENKYVWKGFESLMEFINSERIDKIVSLDIISFNKS